MSRRYKKLLESYNTISQQKTALHCDYIEIQEKLTEVAGEYEKEIKQLNKKIQEQKNLIDSIQFGGVDMQTLTEVEIILELIELGIEGKDWSKQEFQVINSYKEFLIDTIEQEE